ncbi:GTP-dependent dephospho-CoA kinase [Thermococcus sp.]
MLFRLTKELRQELKKPLGELIRGPIPEPYLRIRDELRDKTVITIGDVVTENVLRLGISPSLALYDLKTKRADYSPDINAKAVFMTVSNPPGTITKALLDAVRKAFRLIERGRPVHILVSGEEDLGAIPAVLYAPYGSVVLYGQPDEGVVLIKVTPECKRRCARILAKMEVICDGD